MKASKGYITSTPKEKAYLIGIHTKDISRDVYELSMFELQRLAETADIIVEKTFIQAIDKPDPTHWIGSGKLQEIINEKDKNNITTLIFNDNLNSSQARNIAKKTKCNIVDRTELILDIFAKHAKTNESKLQVELAQLEYSYSKLRNLWQHFSRIVGGIGIRGPGEKQIEIDRRAVRKRISLLKSKLNDIKKTTEIKRKNRSQLSNNDNAVSVCLVGYTNAGKSTLFNHLTKETIYTADKLFATLDSTTRYLEINNKKIILTDTIGFIEKLPTTLIQSFYSTLFEVREADLLLHIVDINNPCREEYIETVNNVLKEINAFDKDIILVFNKCDTFNTLHNLFQKKHLSNKYKNCIFLSAKTGENIQELKNEINLYINKRRIFKKYYIPYEMQNLISFLHKNADVQELTYDSTDNLYYVEAYIDKKIEKNIQLQLDKSSLLNYIKTQNKDKRKMEDVMISNLQAIFSQNILGMKRSAIRELLKLTQNPEIISFAGGLPSPESFPVEELKTIIAKMMDEEATLALQYGATEGDMLLRKLLLEMYQKEGFDIDIDNIVIVTASQQALDLVSKVFINRGDVVICGLPSYLGGLSAFNSYGAKMVGVPLDEDGMSVVELEKTLKDLSQKGIKPKFIYTIPDFQNPAGITMSKQRRIDLLNLAKKYDVLILEDSPYRELRYEGEHVPTIFSLDNSGHVINLGTFSKIFAPGFRIGWVVAHKDIIDKFVVAKQATDLCTPPFTQRIAARYLEAGLLQPKIEFIKNLYREKRDVMLKALNDYMPEGVKWTIPEGGLFLFLTCPDKINTSEMFKKAIEQKVAYVTGSSFYCDGTGQNTMRLNFSYCSKEMNIEGIKRLAEVIKKEM